MASDVSGEELLQLEYNKTHRNAYGERMTEAQEQQLERRLTKLCQMDLQNLVRWLSLDMNLDSFGYAHVATKTF